MKQRRFGFFLAVFSILNLVILGRLFYWQIIKGGDLAAVAKRQRLDVEETYAPRGIIYSQDEYPLVTNDTSYRINVYLPNFDVSNQDLVDKISPIIADSDDEEVVEATASAMMDYFSSGRKWLTLNYEISQNKKKIIEEMDLGGIDFEEKEIRDYPEASMAAQLVGFVGSDKRGNPQGYFGLEGNYHQQLSGQPGLLIGESNPFGQTILSGERIEEEMQPGMNLTLHLERAVQFILEDELKKGIETHGAKSGWAVILDPNTGAVLGMASFPNYHPGDFSEYEDELYPNPIVAEGFEPGSVFKPLIMAAAIEEGKVKPETKCTICDGPAVIGDHTVKTWNEKYHPNSTMKEVIANSDNVGMVYVSQQLGKKNILEYLDKFGFGQKTEIDLQEEAELSIRPSNQWYPIDLATVSFGQVVLVTPIQLTRAFAALANGGKLVTPQVVDRIWSRTETIHQFEPKIVGRPISETTAEKVTDMLIGAVENGPVNWTKIDNLVVAGKTGTAQIPIAGHYDDEKTITSFIGFAPANSPKFIMLVSLREPQSSPWGSETAAPVWFNIAEKLKYYWGI
jgi:cell division protein FtsI/penicillin-binding protein 2